MLCNDVFCGLFLSVNIYKLTKKQNKTKQNNNNNNKNKTKQNKTKQNKTKKNKTKTPNTSLYYVDQWLLYRHCSDIPTYEEKCCEKTEV